MSFLARSRWFVGFVLIVVLTVSSFVLYRLHDRVARQTEESTIRTAELVANLSINELAAAHISSGQAFTTEERYALDGDVRTLRGRTTVIGLEIWAWTGQLIYADAEHPVAETTLPAAELARSRRGTTWVQTSQSARERGVRTFEVFVPYDPDKDGRYEAVVEVLTRQDTLAAQVRRSMRDLIFIDVALFALLSVAVLAARTQAVRREGRASRDRLTGLPNRTVLADTIKEHAKIAGPLSEGRLGLAILDLVDFRSVNETLGHSAGDELLVQVARTLQASVRSPDLVVRLGADEFAVLFTSLPPGTEPDRFARGLLDRLRAASFSVRGIRLAVDAVMGIDIEPAGGAGGGGLLRNAEVAVRQAKRLGTPLATYDPTLDTTDVQQLAMLGDLRDAIVGDELFLLYQPKIRLATGDLAGVEALVRWNHPDRGLLPPDTFIPAAESTELIQPLTEWVLRTAITQAAAWRALGVHLPVAVNLSPRSLLNADLTETILGLLSAANLPSDLLELEITETAVMASPITAMRVCGQLNAAGIRLSIDDFGSGYTSLSYLKDLPVTTLKIDRSFIAELAEHPRQQAIVTSTIELGHRLGLVVLAEGIEEDDVQALLTEFGCDEGQGYNISRPVSADAVLTWMERRHAAPAGIPHRR